LVIVDELPVLYNIFVETNVLSPDHSEENICKLLALIGQPARIQILLIVGFDEVCVCHMEAALGMRQASISQHLMILRKAGLVSARRDGRNIYYRLNRLDVLAVIEQAARFLGLDPDAFNIVSGRKIPKCTCTKCNPLSGTCQ
jgi:DNA-binding transcriptional ArsR family regulator